MKINIPALIWDVLLFKQILDSELEKAKDKEKDFTTNPMTRDSLKELHSKAEWNTLGRIMKDTLA